jgi:hypothetical protein
VSSSASSSMALEDGGALIPVPGGRVRSARRGRRSSQRAAAHRSSTALQRLRQQAQTGVDHTTVRQRFDDFRSSANRGINNINNLAEEELRDQMDEFQGLYSSRSEELRQSQQDATWDRYTQLHVPRIGCLPSPRPHGTFRWMYCQVNGLASAKSRKSKIYDTWELAEKYDVDGIAFVEVGVNWRKFKTSGRLSSWFETLAEREIRSSEAFNQHAPVVSARQQGGTAFLLRHGLLEYSHGTAHDSRNLGRWASWLFYSNQDHRTRVITAYCPGSRKHEGPQTVYTQHLNEINRNGWDTTPYALFVNDLLAAIRCWRAAGDRIILFIDSNEHIVTGPLSRRLTHASIGLSEITHKFWMHGQEPNTHFRGSQPIDGIYVSPEIEVGSFLSLSFHEGVGDHRTMIVDFSTASMIGHHQGHIVRPTSRRLTTKQPSSVTNYNSTLLTLLTAHRIPERLRSISAEAVTGPVNDMLRDKAENLFNEVKQYRIGAEHSCRKILKPHSPFSLPVKYWYDRIHTFRDLIKLKQGNNRRMGKSRILRSAKRLHIPNAATLSIDDCKEGIRLSIIQQKEVRKQDAAHRSQHLGNCLQSAMDSGDEHRIQAVKTRLKNERDRNIWRRINKVTRPALGRSCMQVQVESNGQTTSFHNKEDIEREIQQECESRFKLGHSAPITHSLLGEDLHYFQHPDIAVQILDGSYPIPDDMDQPTALMITEMGRLGRTLRQQEYKVMTDVSKDEYQQYFARINENTSSSPSGLHLGHDKAAAKSDELSSIFALQMNTILTSGIHPSRWGVALQVMLEKIAGVCLVDKLRSIQLYEADYNWFNKFVFNDGALRALEMSDGLPEEHFSHRGRTAEDACFDKTLTVDISRQSRMPMALISVDAAQCYDRVNHNMMSLVWLALQVPIKAVTIIVSCLQYMKIFTRTGWGDSRKHFGGQEQAIPFCGLGQGSKAAPASWIQLSSLIVNVYKSMGFGAKITDPITGEQSHTIGCLFVDDTDLYGMNDSLTTHAQVAATAGIQISWWSRLLNTTGGAIKGSKSFWYLLAYVCRNGIWSYAYTEEVVEVPLPNGESISLTSKPATHVEKTLGVLTAPCGGHAAQLASICEKSDNWSYKILNGHLPATLVWRSYCFQLRARLLYALGTLTNDLASAEHCLHRLEFKLLPQLGVNRHIKRGWRRLHQTFGGVGLIDLPVEQFICRINIFMQHYGTPTALGHKLSTSIHWLQLQVGCLDSPFSLPYAQWSHLSPLCWTKCFWETIDRYDVDMRILYASLPIQRTGDKSIMEFLLPLMTTPSIMASINRCRCHLNMIFLSDITTMDGCSVNSDMIWGSRTILHSKLRFPPEHPTAKDWLVWTDIWTSATGRNLSLSLPLGQWLKPPHFTWPWRYNTNTHEIYILGRTGYNVYRRPTTTWATRSSSLHHQSSDYLQSVSGHCVTLDCIPSPSGYSYTTPVPANGWKDDDGKSSVVDFWDKVREWGGLWMWEMIFPDVGLGFDVSWMIASLKAGTLVGVTDGSYDRQRSPRVCAAGWLIMDVTTGSRLAGSFSEYSTSASSYRGELLGLCAINIILLALAQIGEITNRPPITVWCDNKGAINSASDSSRRIKCGRPCADILRILRSIRCELPLSATFRHVKSHMDDKLSWEQLTLEQQLNCDCDDLAKASITRAIEASHAAGYQRTELLPKESVGVFIHQQKITSDPTNSLRYQLSKVEAKLFLTSQQGWSIQQFDDVGWDWLHTVLASKPVMFRLWLSKQHSNFCAAGLQMKRCKLSEDDRCPSCWARKERAGHLCKCPSESRTKLFLDTVAELENWLTLNNNTDSELAYWLIKYIQGRGNLKFAELGQLSPNLQQLARSQDKIGWRNMMEGRVSKLFYGIQCVHLSTSHSRINGDDWMKGLIGRLIHISHAQWLFRNFTLHDTHCGYNRLKDKLAVQLQIAELSQTDPERIPEHSRFLLEIDTEILKTQDYESQVYWVTAMEAARQARTAAIMLTTSTRPALTSFGSFTVRETIRRETRDMLGNRGLNMGDDSPLRPNDGRNMVNGLTDSDRRRKPD